MELGELRVEARERLAQSGTRAEDGEYQAFLDLRYAGQQWTLTVPVAGLVMLVGFPLGLVAGLGPESIASLVMYPVEIAVAWIALVARLFSL